MRTRLVGILLLLLSLPAPAVVPVAVPVPKAFIHASGRVTVHISMTDSRGHSIVEATLSAIPGTAAQLRVSDSTYVMPSATLTLSAAAFSGLPALMITVETVDPSVRALARQGALKEEPEVISEDTVWVVDQPVELSSLGEVAVTVQPVPASPSDEMRCHIEEVSAFGRCDLDYLDETLPE